MKTNKNIVTTALPGKDWRTKIRNDYKGILPDTQIEATIKYWESFISTVEKEAREDERKRIIEIDVTKIKSLLEGEKK